MSSHQRTKQLWGPRVLSNPWVDRFKVNSDGITLQHVAEWQLQPGCPYYEHLDGQMTDWTGGGREKYKDCTHMSFAAKYYGSYGVGDSAEIALAEHAGPLTSDYFLARWPVSDVIIRSSIYGRSLDNTLVNPETMWVEDPHRTLDRVRPESVRHLEDLLSCFGTKRGRIIEITWDPLDWDFSIWFLLVDIIQLKGLYRSLVSSGSQFQRLRAMAGDKTIRQLSDDHLAVTFGLIPTLADLKQFVDVIGKFQRAYRENNPELKKKRYWRVKPPVMLDGYFPTGPLFGDYTAEIRPGVSSGISVHCRRRLYTAVQHGTLSYTYQCPEFHGFLARLGQFADALGLVDPAAAWDAVPFSFVVDWFYGVGSYLHKNRPRFFPCDVQIQDYCESIKVQSANDWYVSYYRPNQDPDGSWSGYPVVKQYIGTEEHTSYIRRRFDPSYVYIIRTPSLPNLGTSPFRFRRVFTSLALLGQRVRLYDYKSAFRFVRQGSFTAPLGGG